MAIKQTPIYEIAKKSNAEFSEQGGWQIAQNFGKAVSMESVALCDQSHNGKIRIEGKTAGAMLQADELAIGGGKAVEAGRIYRLRRDLFFVMTEAGAVADVVLSLTNQAANHPDLITVTDVTHGSAELWLIGPNSAELLSRLCGLDFHDSQFPNGTAKQSSVAKTTQLIIRRDLGEHPAYALIGGRSLAAYLWQTILEAGQDLGIQPVGNAVLAELGD
ncbi:MAG: aminomethyltransferase family protein [Anaerolineales bacterium]|nr:aminomethyltransferase family protein [Anaerolineales bacterium]